MRSSQVPVAKQLVEHQRAPPKKPGSSAATTDARPEHKQSGHY